MAVSTDALVSILTNNPGTQYNTATGKFSINGTPIAGNWGYTGSTGGAVSDGGQTVMPQAVSGTGAPAMNVPYGFGYLDPMLDAYTRILGLVSGERNVNAEIASRNQIANQQAALTAAQYLASLYAAGPQSAAELAFAQAGRGVPAIGGSAANIADLIGNATRGATGQTSASPGGQTISIPNTLSGAQLQGLAGNPNLAGVMQSFATASGNPDLFKRSIAALIPSNFQAYGSGF